MDLAVIKAHVDNCKNETDPDWGLPLLPVYTDFTRNISFLDAFSDSTPVCPEVNANGSGSGNVSNGSGKYNIQISVNVWGTFVHYQFMVKLSMSM